MTNKKWITWVVIIAVIILAIYLLKKPTKTISEELAKCIGENSELYVQLGCLHCETQEEMFGDNLQYLDRTDCFYEGEFCREKEIEYTPTWIINGQKIVGVQSVENLKSLTGCSEE